ncbi:cytochrome P450 3A8-like [Uloborus diversus]|uniref:cytochrome P450 3A8-like n=1 Tax=Uloborus diversus TaxID=327109 RepID=UPI0024098F15|nr:cytochrome P450 3A8-like [Uloborus diversus]
MENYSQAVLWIATFAALAVFIYKYLTKNYDYWAQQNIPFIKPRLVLGSVKLGDKPLHELEQEMYEKYGRIYGRYDGMMPVLSVADPDLLKRIFVKDFHIFQNRRDLKFNDPIMDNTLFVLEGAAWKRVRKIVSPTLTSGKLRKMLPLLEECSNLLVDNLAQASRRLKNINCQRIFGAFTVDAIAKCAFGISVNSLRNENDPFVAKAKMLLQCFMSWRTIVTVIFPRLMKWLRISLLNPETTEFYKNIIVQVVEERKKASVKRDDFLQLLLDAETEINDPNNNTKTQCSEEDCSKVSCSTEKPEVKGLSHDEFLSQCITFFLAGYDATTSLLSYAIYNLAINQKCQETAVNEIESVLKRHERVLNYESLSEMKYMDAILNECLRLCPSLVRSERRAEEDCLLGDDIVLKKGMLISIPVYAIHRDPEWYPEPDAFKPERFYHADPNRPQYVHLPFGAGPRVCVGMRFVQTQVKMCLAKVLQRFQVVPSSLTPEKIKLIEMRNILKVDNVEVSMVERGILSGA